MMPDREEKKLEIRNLMRKRFWPLVPVYALWGTIGYFGVVRYFNPEMGNCLGRILDDEALFGCPAWFSATPLWVWIAIFVIGLPLTYYLFNKLIPQLKQLREETPKVD